MWSKKSRRIEPIARSRYPFCQGDRGAMGRSGMPTFTIDFNQSWSLEDTVRKGTIATVETAVISARGSSRFCCCRSEQRSRGPIELTFDRFCA